MGKKEIESTTKTKVNVSTKGKKPLKQKAVKKEKPVKVVDTNVKPLKGKTAKKEKPVKVVVDVNTKAYLTVSEIQQLYGLTSYHARKLVEKTLKIDTKTVKNDRNMDTKGYKKATIDSYFGKIEKQHSRIIEGEIEPDNNIEGLENFLLKQQEYFGGSTSKAKWCQDNPVVWGKSPLHTNQSINNSIFFDTIILSIPVEVWVYKEYDGNFTVNTYPESIKKATEISKRYFEGVIPRYSGEHHSLTLTNVEIDPKPKKKRGLSGIFQSEERDVSKVIITQDTLQHTIIPRRKAKISDEMGLRHEGHYLAYQNFRLSTSNGDFSAVKVIIDQIRESAELILNNPVLITRFDITTNLPGAVKPMEYAVDLSMYGLKAKVNKHLVSETTHTYVYMESKDDDSTIPYTKGMENDELISLKQYTTIQRRLNHIAKAGMDYKNFLLDFLKVETLSNQTQLIETKIYDKFRFMLECGNVANNVSGLTALGNLVDSTKAEIQKAFTTLNQSGISRIESRFRGMGTLLPKVQMLKIHRLFCKVLSTTYSNITPFQYSIDSFLKTVKANVAVIVDHGDNASCFYGVAQWVNSITKRIQGRVTASDGTGLKFINEVDFNNWIHYQSNRHVPLVILTVVDTSTSVYKRGVKGAYKLIDVNVIKPTLKGFSNILPVDGEKTTFSGKADKPFNGFEMPPFKASSINAPIRDIRMHKVFEGAGALKDAFDFARESLKAFNNRNKKTKTTKKEKKEKTESVYDMVKESVYGYLNAGKVAKTMELKRSPEKQSGYLIEKDGVVYVARFTQKIGKDVVVYIIQPDKDFDLKAHIPYKVDVYLLSRKGKSYYKIDNQ